MAAGQLFLASQQAKLIKRGNRATAKGFTTPATGFLRLDAIPVEAGKGYLFAALRLRATFATTTDRGKFQMHLNDTGAAATTADTIIGRAECYHATSHDLCVPYWPVANANVSILVAVLRTSGASAGTLQSDESGVDLLAMMIDPDNIADSGVDA